MSIFEFSTQMILKLLTISVYMKRVLKIRSHRSSVFNVIQLSIERNKENERTFLACELG